MRAIIFKKYSTNVVNYTYRNIYFYEHMHAHPISLSTSERLIRFNLEIYIVSHQEYFDGNIVSHWKNN
jgi:hypothetical protein